MYGSVLTWYLISKGVSIIKTGYYYLLFVGLNVVFNILWIIYDNTKYCILSNYGIIHKRFIICGIIARSHTFQPITSFFFLDFLRFR